MGSADHHKPPQKAQNSERPRPTEASEEPAGAKERATGRRDQPTEGTASGEHSTDPQKRGTPPSTGLGGGGTEPTNHAEHGAAQGSAAEDDTRRGARKRQTPVLETLLITVLTTPVTRRGAGGRGPETLIAHYVK